MEQLICDKCKHKFDPPRMFTWRWREKNYLLCPDCWKILHAVRRMFAAYESQAIDSWLDTTPRPTRSESCTCEVDDEPCSMCPMQEGNPE